MLNTLQNEKCDQVLCHRQTFSIFQGNTPQRHIEHTTPLTDQRHIKINILF